MLLRGTRHRDRHQQPPLRLYQKFMTRYSINFLRKERERKLHMVGDGENTFSHETFEILSFQTEEILRGNDDLEFSEPSNVSFQR